MLKFLLLVILTLPLSGCLDGLGIGSACESEMQDVRRAHGAPDQRERGLRSEIWLYGRGPGGFFYEFNWGAAGDPCEVIGPVNQNRIQDGMIILTAMDEWTYLASELSNSRGGKSP